MSKQEMKWDLNDIVARTKFDALFRATEHNILKSAS
jgi:hypothetical protein